MNNSIVFKNKNYDHLSLNISPKASFKEILEILYNVEFNNIKISTEHIIYAILELLNNSLRAHRDNKIEKEINSNFVSNDSNIVIKITDWGKGFNPNKLPYDLNDNINKIDLNGDSFQKYREAHEYLRFGMGLYLAKKTFSSFKLSFIDKDGKEIEWKEDSVAGTCIELTMEKNS